MITTAKRRELIIDPLCREGASRVEPLSQLLSVSSVTIRINRDVKHILADASKFGRTSFCMIREVGQIHRLVTDSRIPAHYLQALHHLGIDVIIADR